MAAPTSLSRPRKTTGARSAGRSPEARVRTTAAGRPAAVVVALAVAAGVASAAPGAAAPPPGSRLLTYLWSYQNEVLRPYVSRVAVTGGHAAVVDGKSRFTGATVNVRSSLRDQPATARAARAICRAARSGLQKLHLVMISAVRVWSAEGHTVARC